ncbi:ribonuclease R [Colwellia sp. 4_MG-2023]|uniref:ribonuclease R n=1 Tax=unclassified Colwellia TaxID=196834 RepID=UPI0026E2A853|nr:MULTISPECIES: ribonuclease R [unclassified Colwellia]MDO6506195.1 ribonuclease R [Colwellia sp. 5_MG-2023]MDO6554745.1 ribonuclease R [Colwellia sp. 4_MG-2023]
MTLNDPHAKREAKKYEKPVASRELLLSIIEKCSPPPTFNTLAKTLNYQEDHLLVGLKRRLRAMENSGQLIFNKFKQYAIPAKNSLLTGQVLSHRDGFGFLVVDDADLKSTSPDKRGKDFYISTYEMQRVFHGDIVQAILVERTDRKGKKEVKILDVIEPRKAPIVGRFNVQQHICSVVPEDSKIKQEILIDPKARLGARHGQMVVVELAQRPTKRSKAIGNVIEVLGDHMAPGMEIEIALRAHDLPHQFSHTVEAEVATIADEVEESAKLPRKDLRELPLVTIDGEDARDFDDAVYCQPEKSGGWRLWVAIADVSYYVRHGSALDDEAISRGNSVYFPSQVIPMLPEKLSNGLCSLNPDVDRLCMVCEMTVSSDGELTGSQFYPAVMRSHARFTYSKVAAILDAKDNDGVEAMEGRNLREQYSALVPDLENLKSMYLALSDARTKRGAIAFETEESLFLFNKDKKIESVVPLIRNDAHKIIEECMILANVSTAKFIEKHNKPGLFRVHDKPSEEKYNNFVSYLSELGITIPKRDQPEPRDYCDILTKVAERPDQELIQTMLLRSMRQAVYQSDNLGHFGLALASYSHFTSPIRRYPDLVVHRVIKSILLKEAQDQATKEANAGAYDYKLAEVIELGEHCSMTERRADEATRDVSDWLKCEFMQDHVGDSFNGVISTVTNFGMFVRLHELHIEGLVHITSLGQDYYHYDDVRMCLTGEKSGVKYRVGDVVTVQVAAVNLDEKKIDLAMEGSSAVKKGALKAKGKRKPSAKSTKKPSTDTKDKSKVKSKAKKRSERKKRPGKNARKNAVKK